MGNQLEYIKGFGETKQESFNSLKSCFIYYYGRKQWEKCHYFTKHKDDDNDEQLIRKSYEKHYVKFNDITYPILWTDSNDEYKCYISL